MNSPYGYYDDCLRWPRPSRWVHPVPQHPTYPDVPTLVINGDLDSLTSPEGGRATARAFPNSTFVETANSVHISALIDFDQCASVLVRRFVRDREAGDTSCAARYHENRLVGHFARKAVGTGWHGAHLRTARVAAATAADVLARWLSMYTTQGVGLRGGTFTVHGGSFWRAHPVVVWKLDKVRWVRDVAVSGTMRWHRRSGLVTADVDVSGAGALPARLRLTWNDLEPLGDGPGRRHRRPPTGGLRLPRLLTGRSRTTPSYSGIPLAGGASSAWPEVSSTISASPMSVTSTSVSGSLVSPLSLTS